MQAHSLFGESSVTVVAAVFTDAPSAFRAADLLRAREAASDLMVDVVHPGDGDLIEKLEPDSRGIFLTALRAHAWLGIAFLLVGTLAGIALLAAGWPAAVASPMLTLLFTSVIGGFAGLMLGGLLTLRPDRGAVIRRVREASRRGRWAVVAHPVDLQQAQLARRQLSTAGGWVVSSF
jgi:hypothetical protein